MRGLHVNKDLHKSPSTFCFQMTKTDSSKKLLDTGWIMDASGNLFAFKKENSNSKWHHINNSIIKATDLANEFSAYSENIYQINKEDIFDIHNHSKEIPKGPFSCVIYKENQTITTSFYLFQYDSFANTYKKVLVYQDGEFSQANMHPKASKIISWLIHIQEIYNSKTGN